MSKVFKNNPQQSKLILEELEERRLFSGGIEGLIASELDSEAQAIYADADKAKTANANDEASAAAAERQTQEIVFVDAGVDNYQQLVDDLNNNADSNRNIEVVVLDQDKDGIEEISEFLSHREDLDAIHIISHGSDGSVELGNTSLNAATLEQNNLKIALWANNFADTGDILIYNTVNSGLLNDNITAMATDPVTGDLWIGTAEGISRLISQTSNPTDDIDQVLAFPNPFLISSDADRLSFNYDDNAFVRIYTVAGELIWENDITINWTGRNQSGNKVASGVYHFLLTDENGSTGQGKILLVRE